MTTQRALWWWWLLFCWTLPWEIDFGQRQCHVSSPLLCLIVVYLKSVPTGNFFLPGYLGISLCLSCWAKGIKQFWLCCCYALSRQLKRGVAMAQRIYFSCLHAHWGALLVSLLKCVRETSIDPNLLCTMQAHNQKGYLSWGSLVLQRKTRQELKPAQIGAGLSEFSPNGWVSEWQSQMMSCLPGHVGLM